MRRREFVKAVGALSVAGLGLDARGAIDDAQRVPRRPLGRTGVEVSVLALGGVIGMQLPPARDHDPVALAEQALDLGITYFDTAPSYNNGQSETNYGRVLARRRGEVFLATKTGDRSRDGGSCMPITPPSARTLTSTPVPPRGRRGSRFASSIAPRASSPGPATERAPTALMNSRLLMVLSSDRPRCSHRPGFRPLALT